MLSYFFGYNEKSKQLENKLHETQKEKKILEEKYKLCLREIEKLKHKYEQKTITTSSPNFKKSKPVVSKPKVRLFNQDLRKQILLRKNSLKKTKIEPKKLKQLDDMDLLELSLYNIRTNIHDSDSE